MSGRSGDENILLSIPDIENRLFQPVTYTDYGFPLIEVIFRFAYMLSASVPLIRLIVGLLSL